MPMSGYKRAMVTPPDTDNFTVWQTDPTPDNLRTVVDEMGPTIHNVLSSFQGQGDPYLKSKARTLTAKAVQSYDPAYGANLKTWVSRQLMPLRRIRRQHNTPIHTPESIQLDLSRIHRAEQDLTDKFNREPDMLELADELGMPVSRIAKVKSHIRTAGAEGALIDEQGAASQIAGDTGSSSQELLDYLYAESDYIDKKILEGRLGYGGSPELSTKDLSMKLQMSDAQISRRAAKLSAKLKEYMDALEEVSGA
jgi:DNA-directed RNA polymerase specialized sigma subunit